MVSYILILTVLKGNIAYDSYVKMLQQEQLIKLLKKGIFLLFSSINLPNIFVFKHPINTC